MTANTVTDGEINDRLDGKFADLKRRIREGTLPLGPVADAVQNIIEGRFKRSDLLVFVGIVKLKAVKRFVVADHFKEGVAAGGRPIAWLGSNFQHHFGDVVEEDVPGRTINVWQLAKYSRDPAIIADLGGEEKPELQIHLAHMWQMMELGEKAHCRIDVYANFGYKISPKDGKLWVPGWGVGGGGLRVEARSSSYPYEWYDGGRVSGG
ncbi:hypothetical protein C4568_02895 [Candidatus Parcubacteria bacterium]|nr:MAG: hypothetical protein C4568_02895 [Candidatus Parcubacteria bacterium]